MKSEVKKKMMLDEHATPTPKSLKQAQLETSIIGNRFDRLHQREFPSALDGIVYTIYSGATSVLKQ